MAQEFICTVCPRGCHLRVGDDMNVTGNSCPRGLKYAIAEVTAPTRVVTSTVKIDGAALRRCPVRTAGPIPKGLMGEAVKALDAVTLTAPVETGDVVIPDVLGTGIDFIATKSFEKI